MKNELDDIVRDVIRDKNGFATEECLDEIGNSLPVLLISMKNGAFVIDGINDEEDYADYRGEIDRNVSYTNWISVNEINRILLCVKLSSEQKL